MYGYDADNSSQNVFKLRFSLEEEEELEKFGKDTQKWMKKYIEKETKDIKFRSFEYVETLLNELQGKYREELEKLKARSRLAYNIFLNRKKTEIETLLKKEEQFEKKLAQAISDELPSADPADVAGMVVLNQILLQIVDSLKLIKESLALERIKRSKKTSVSKIINTLTAIFMLYLRIFDLGKMWTDLTEEKRNQLQDLIYWDLEVLREKVELLPAFKAPEADVIEDKKVLELFLG
jgi:Fe2+ transport system protein B